MDCQMNVVGRIHRCPPLSLGIMVESFLELFEAACHLEQQGRDLPHQSFRLSRTLSFPIELEPLLIVGSLEEFVCLFFILVTGLVIVFPPPL